ncbi:Hypothetical predicted protein, partial [Mytilus galloprovincialis]
LQKEILQHWSNVLNKFVLTKAAQLLYQQIQAQNVIAIIGPTGTGKSACACHIAYRLKNEHDYTIVPARQPSDILQYCIPGTNQVFVIDDFIGKYAFDEAEGISWEKMGPLLQKILSNNKQTKVILTCRKSIWLPKKSERFGFSALVCDLHKKEFRLTLSEKRQIFESYIDRGDAEPLNDEIIMMYTFFPSLCSFVSSRNVGDITSFFTMPVQFIEEEINNYEEKSQALYISLAVLAIKQKITKQSFFNDIENNELIKTLFRESGFQTPPSKKLIISHLVALTDTYVKGDDDCFEFIHETMQNIILYCIAKTFLISVLKYSKSDVFKNQVRLACVGEEQTVPVIKVKSEHEEAYFTRLRNELIKGQYRDVFDNNQNAFALFRKKLLEHLKRYRNTISLKTKSDDLTVLHVVSSLGYEEYVSYFIDFDYRMVYKQDLQGNTPLHLATLNGHLDIVKSLSKQGRNVHILNKDEVSPFFYACEKNNISVVRYLTNFIGDLVKINEKYTTKEHKSVLHIACLNGFTQIVQILLDHHANVDIQDTNGLTPLHITCMNGQVDSASLLIISRANVNAFDRLQRTPVYYACTGKYKDIVELLIEYKADINRSTSTGHTPLHAACDEESIETVKILLKNHVNVNMKEKTGEIPLHIACRRGNEHTVKLLIDNGAVVNSRTIDECTPLIEACCNGHTKVTNILLNNNANYQQKTKKGWTALLFSCAKGYNDIVKMLLNLEVDVNIPNKDGTTPLMLACRGNHTDVVESLLLSNADVNQCNKVKSSPLEYTCYAGNIDIVNLLLELGARTNLANINGLTPLHIACMNKHEKVVSVLIEKKADISSKDLIGETPLYKACVIGDIKIVKILLNKGAKINLTDTSGKSPAAIANDNGFSSIVELLDNANTVLV